LKHQRVGSVQGYAYGKEIMPMFSVPDIENDSIAGDKALLANIGKLIHGRIDTVVGNNMVMDYTLAHDFPGTVLRNAGCARETLSFYIPFSPARANSALYASLLSKGVVSLRKNGTLNDILARYGLKDWKGNPPR